MISPTLNVPAFLPSSPSKNAGQIFAASAGDMPSFSLSSGARSCGVLPTTSSLGFAAFVLHASAAPLAPPLVALSLSPPLQATTGTRNIGNALIRGTLQHEPRLYRCRAS